METWLSRRSPKPKIESAMDLDLARGMMFYAANLLGYRCPDNLPEIRIEPDLDCLRQIRWPFLQRPVTALRHWRAGNLKDQCVLVHELVHWIQHCNGVEMTGNRAQRAINDDLRKLFHQLDSELWRCLIDGRLARALLSRAARDQQLQQQWSRHLVPHARPATGLWGRELCSGPLLKRGLLNNAETSDRENGSHQ